MTDKITLIENRHAYAELVKEADEAYHAALELPQSLYDARTAHARATYRAAVLAADEKFNEVVAPLRTIRDQMTAAAEADFGLRVVAALEDYDAVAIDVERDYQAALSEARRRTGRC